VDQLVALHEGQASSSCAPSDFIAYHGLRNTVLMHFKCMPTSVLLRHGGLLLLAHLLTVVRQTLSGRLSVMWRVYRDSLKQLPGFARKRKQLQNHLRIAPSQLDNVIATGFYRMGYTRQVIGELIKNIFRMRKSWVA
jgi:hypothetical protein